MDERTRRRAIQKFLDNGGIIKKLPGPNYIPSTRRTVRGCFRGVAICAEGCYWKHHLKNSLHMDRAV